MTKLLRIQAKALALTAILLVSIVSISSAQKIAIIDAGSSGSRLYVYEIKDNGRKIDLLYPDSAQKSKSKGRALSSIANHNDSVSAFLDTMANKYASPDTTEIIPLYILATAGMRMVPEGRADSIYQKMHVQATKLQEAKKYQRLHLEKAMTISGRYEGLYAWIAANHKYKKLKINDPTSSKAPASSSFGILEIGGASMQIAFEMDKNKQCDDSIHHNNLGCIYSKSYLGGGVDQVYKTYCSSSKITVELGNMTGLHTQVPKFLGLGKPIEALIRATNSSKLDILKQYGDTLQNNDSPENFHPWINARYMTQVVDSFKLDNKLILPEYDSDWTQGAALDIIFYKREPEKFNYQSRK